MDNQVAHSCYWVVDSVQECIVECPAMAIFGHCAYWDVQEVRVKGYLKSSTHKFTIGGLQWSHFWDVKNNRKQSPKVILVTLKGDV